MKDNITNGDIPLGLGMALAQNVPAFEEFANMSETQRRAVIEGARKVSSKQEMQSYVENISQGKFE